PPVDGAPHPAVPPPPYPPGPRRRGRPAPARALARLHEEPGHRPHGRVEEARARGTPPAREAVLPPAPRRGRADPGGRSTADARGGEAAADGPRVRRSRVGAA